MLKSSTTQSLDTEAELSQTRVQNYPSPSWHRLITLTSAAQSPSVLGNSGIVFNKQLQTILQNLRLHCILTKRNKLKFYFITFSPVEVTFLKLM